VWKLSRSGAEPGADRRRNMRWERLEGVLRELDDLRDRGEQAVSKGVIPTDQEVSVPVEAGRGNPLGPQLEAPLERSDGTPP
jgi:hypothetical protein